jgi:predicted ATPase
MAAVAVRKVQAARRATVCIASAEGGGELEPRGQGLLFDDGKDKERVFVLTCHHIVVRIQPDDLCVVMRPSREVVRAEEVEERSYPQRDAVVLAVPRPTDVVEQPWLHVLTSEYDGGLAAQGLTYLAAESFEGRVGSALEELRVPARAPVGEYTLPIAYPLQNVTDAREGISGSVVLCEKGVLGLVHFARAAGARQERTAYVNPLSAWAENWPELEVRLNPFVDEALWQRAEVIRADLDEIEGRIAIDSYRDDVYIRRAIDERAQETLDQKGGVLLLGRPKSGKSRLARELVRRQSGALLLIPKARRPPEEFEESTFAECDVVLLADNLDGDPDALAPLDWWDRINRVSGRLFFIGTCRGGDDWERVLSNHPALAARLQRENALIYTSDPPVGHDLTLEQGWEMAERLKITRAEFNRRFDGTPGSIIGGEGPDEEIAELPAGERAGVALERLTKPPAEADVPTNVPSITSGFIERPEEAKRLRELLDAHRIVTVTAPAGAGKTRLALQVASELLDLYRDGVWVVDLSFEQKGSLVPLATVAAVDLPDASAPPPTRRLIEYLKDKRALLVLNGCDHVVAAAARFAEELTDACAKLDILTTCRKRIGVRDEGVLELEPLTALSGTEAAGEQPGGETAASQLFMERARETRPNATFSPDEVAAVAEMTHSLDGNPLAIELLASQAVRTGVRALANRLIQYLERQDLPEDRPDEGLRATVELVSEQLPAAQLFELVSVFAGGFTLEAARSVAGEAGLEPEQVPSLLRDLVDRRLVLIDKRDDGAERYRLLESLREQARERLVGRGDVERAERAHAQYCLELARRARAHIGEPEEVAWLDRLERDIANIRAALSWSIGRDQWKVGFALGAALWWFWYQRSHLTEGRRWLRELRALGERTSPGPEAAGREEMLAWAELLNGAGNFAQQQGDLDEAEELHSKALELRRALGEVQLVAGSLNNLGLVSRRRGNGPRAERLFREAIEISRSVGNPFWEAMHYNNLGNVLREFALDSDEARACQEASLTICTHTGAAWGTAQALSALGLLAADARNLDDARHLLERACAIRMQIGNPQGIAESLNGLGRVDRLGGDYVGAAEKHRRALAGFEPIGDRISIAETLEALGLAIAASDPHFAGRVLATAEILRNSLGAPLPPIDLDELGAVKASLGEAIKTGSAEARSRSLHATIAEATAS